MSVMNTLQIDRDTALWALAKSRFGDLTNQELGTRLDETLIDASHSITVLDEVDDEEDCDIIRDML